MTYPVGLIRDDEAWSELVVVASSAARLDAAVSAQPYCDLCAAPAPPLRLVLCTQLDGFTGQREVSFRCCEQLDERLRVLDRVDRGPAFWARDHQSSFFETGEVLGDRALRQP